MNDCRNCKHNSYLPDITYWVSCGHQITIAKQPKYEAGDPAFVTWSFSDFQASRVPELGDCPTFEPFTHNATN